MWNPSGTEPPLLIGDMLLNKPYVESSSMDPYSAVDTAATAQTEILVVGDFSRYVILDRVGTSIELVPTVFDTANNLLSGVRGFSAHRRVGAGVLDINAFWLLIMVTAA